MNTPTVFVVDDDAGIRYSLSILFETAKLKVESFASAEDFLAALHPEQAGCLLLDVRMPGMSGPQLHEQLVQRGHPMPVIFMTAYADTAVALEAMKRGAAGFLTKPVNGGLLLQRVRETLELPGASPQRQLPDSVPGA